MAVMNTNDQKKSIDLTNGRVVSGAICAGFVPTVIFLVFAVIQSNNEVIFFLILGAVLSAVPGFLSIFIPCFVLLWFGKTKPSWFVMVPPFVIAPSYFFIIPFRN